MLEASLTGCEAERLSALRSYRILDTPPEQAFDDLTWLAAQWCQTPIALVSLVDVDRQWFKSRVGLDASETPRRVAFCSHALLHPDEVMVVKDARLDERFADNPIVTGEPRVIFYAGAPLVTPDGLPLGTLCVIDHEPRELDDVARDALKALARQVVSQLELRRSCDRLDKTAQELAQLNQDLSEFTYIAAHDLQEPLRKLTSFSQLLEEDVGEDISAAAKEDLGFIKSAAGRMNRLISDLLRLSRVGAQGFERKTILLGDCLASALENLESRIEETGAVIDCEELPAVDGNFTFFTQVFQNLVGNALKFSNADEPRITIKSLVADGETIVIVSDNGIGMDPESLDKIFAPFKRLHGRDAYAGTGIGLAIVRKAIERHGGRVWVESRPGEGSDFQFTVPVVAHATGNCLVEV